MHQRADSRAGQRHDRRAELGDRRRRWRRRQRAHKAMRLRDKHDRHHDELRDQRELRKRERKPAEFDGSQSDAQCLGESDQERREERPGDGTQPSHDGDDECLGDDREVHTEIGRLARQL
jgi:hypothetical protein